MFFLNHFFHFGAPYKTFEKKRHSAVVNKKLTTSMHISVFDLPTIQIRTCKTYELIREVSEEKGLSEQSWHSSSPSSQSWLSSQTCKVSWNNITFGFGEIRTKKKLDKVLLFIGAKFLTTHLKFWR